MGPAERVLWSPIGADHANRSELPLPAAPDTRSSAHAQPAQSSAPRPNRRYRACNSVRLRKPSSATGVEILRDADARLLPLEEVKLLIDRGADVNAKSASGQTALDIAKLRGDTPIVDLLVRSGAKTASVIPPVLKL